MYGAEASRVIGGGTDGGMTAGGVMAHGQGDVEIPSVPNHDSRELVPEQMLRERKPLDAFHAHEVYRTFQFLVPLFYLSTIAAALAHPPPVSSS